jgi:hypothetical protein
MGLLDKKPGPEPKFTRGHHLGQYFFRNFCLQQKWQSSSIGNVEKSGDRPSPEDLVKSGCKPDMKNKYLIIVLCF